MQAQRIETPPPRPSPPPAVVAEGSLKIDTAVAASPARSVEPSPTQTLGHSSPELPPLPQLPSLGGIPRTPHTAAAKRPADQSHFYTASWGSPYQQPSPEFHTKSRRHNRDTWALDPEPDDDDSPRFGLDHLIPNRLEESGEPKLKFNLEHLLPKRLPSFLTKDPGDPSTPTKAPKLWPDLAADKTPVPPAAASSKQTPQLFFPREPTEGWIKQFLTGQWQSEKANWWSDGSTDEDSDEGDAGEASQDGQTRVKDKHRKSKKGHKSRKNNLTLKQADFWAHFGQKGKETFEKMLASRFADTPPAMDRPAPQLAPSHPEPEKVDGQDGELKTEVLFDAESRSLASRGTEERSVEEKPPRPISKDGPPPPPKAPSKAPSPVNDAPPPPPPKAAEPTPMPAPVKAADLPPKRPKKRVLWRNRNIVIQIPYDRERGKEGGPPRPLTWEEVEGRLKQFEEAGWSVHGFDTSDDNGFVSNGLAQNREIWPDPAEETHQWRTTHTTRVSIPDRAEWDRYVAFLTEQKLAALGVTLAPEEEIVENPMSRSASAQQFAGGPGLAFSPPPQSISVGSQGFSTFSAPFSLPSGPSPGIPGHMSRTSIASPISPFGNQRPSGHLHRHSTFASPSNIPQQQPTPPGLANFSPSLFLAQNGGARGASPAIPTSAPAPDMMSPVSPFTNNAQIHGQYSFSQSTDTFSQMQQQQQQLQHQLLQQQQQQILNNRPHLTLEELPEEDAEEDLRPQTPAQTNNGPGPNIVVPTPRGSHRHNISENLEREILDAEYHLEEAINRQLDEDGEFGPGNRFGIHSPPSKPTQTNGNATMWQGSNGIQHQSQNRQQSFGGPGYHGHHEDDERTNISDVETNPSIEGQNDQSTGVSSSHTTFASSNLNTSHHVSHSSQGSATSKLNVQAPEFKFPSGQSFNPTAQFSPSSGNFTFGPNFQSEPQQQSGEQRPPPSRGSTKLHAAVPSFVPSFKLGGLGLPQPPVVPSMPAMPTSTFDFAAQGPAFKPDANAFQPGTSQPNGSSQDSGKLFNIDIQEQDIVKPAKRSKAIPIVKPDLQQQQREQEEEEVFDEQGRAMQAEWRQKRARQNAYEGDSEPMFATPRVVPSNAPPQPLGDAVQSQNLGYKDRISPIPEGKENQTPTPNGIQRQATPFKPRGPQQQNEGYNVDYNRGHRTNQNSIDLNEAQQPFDFKFGVHVTKPSTDIHEAQQAGAGLRQFNPSPAVTNPNSYQPSEGGSFMTAMENGKNQPGDADYEDRPTFNEIDEIMRAMNDQGSEFGIIRESPQWSRSSPPPRPESNLQPAQALFRNDAPSPIPQQRLYAPPHNDGGNSSGQDPFSDSKAGLAYESPVHRLGGDNVAVSDWDDIVSTEEENKFKSRRGFFDSRVDGLIDNVLQSRLGPLERSIHTIKDSISAIAMMRAGRTSRRSFSGEPGESDADDEDDDLASQHRNRSPGKNRKLEKIKTAVVEALSQATMPPMPSKSPGIDIAEFYQALADLKMSIARSAATGQLDDFREIMEEALNRQSSVLSQKKQQEANAEAVARIAELERTVDELQQRMEVTIESRKVAERSEDDAQRKLALTEEELLLLRAQGRDDANKIRALNEEAHELKMRLGSSESSQEELRRRLVTLETQNEALEATLDEYRLSSKKWSDEINKANEDNETLRRSISTLESQNQESIRGREKMRHRLEQLQKDLVAATSQVADEKARWSRQEEEHVKKYETLRARIEAEARTRERFEREMERLEGQEREGMRLKVILEQTQRHNASMEEAMNKLRVENSEFQKRAERFEREFHESREIARAEIKRTRMVMEAELNAANNQVNIVRSELESENTRLRNEIDQLRMDRDTEKARHELVLEGEADAKRDALREAHDGRDRALREQQHRYEKAMEDQQQRYEKTMEDQQHRYEREIGMLEKRFAEKVEDHQQRYEKTIEDLHRQHNRDLANAIEDKQHNEQTLNDRLALADEKVEFLQDKVVHLEEKLEVAKSAAHAAAVAAQSAKTPTLPSETVLPSAAERVSPQALRESIAVLQEQLQEREERIEALDQKLSEFDGDAPQKLKEKETEIGWLRELLGVRVDDITDLIDALAQPAFDREQVRDAAIRIRTNLQMEQHEKERLISGGQTFPALASLSNFASPKAAQLAAAIGNWRKGRENAGASKLSRSSSAADNHEQTPSKAPNPSAGFLAGLMTPPASQLRRTPTPSTGRRARDRESFSSSTSARGFPILSSVSQSKQRTGSSLSHHHFDHHQLATPPGSRGGTGLLTKSAYDHDAPDSTFSPSQFHYDEETDGDEAYMYQQQQQHEHDVRMMDGRMVDERYGIGVAVSPDLDEGIHVGAVPQPQMMQFEPFGPGSGFSHHGHQGHQ
ncbi:Trichohyalin [Lasiodiplodia hormozganensis]|uniref:Trichohyalin n=1 Tax=Lasiodiplodia hormozganensis TaxID=869390 RepID=A0AA39XUH0_9PEZI|nr:Trichohyalin [Lasiodiplodia hormozganensis]